MAGAATNGSVVKRGCLAVAGLILVSALALVVVWSSGTLTSSAAAVPTVSVMPPTKLHPADGPTIAGSQLYGIAIRTDGNLWGWGDSTWGGAGFFGTAAYPGQAGEVPQYGPVWAALAADGQHSLGIQSDGTLWGWGWNLEGEVGNNSVVHVMHGPVCISTKDDWVALAAGGRHSLGLQSDGTLWAWGANDHGQLGDGATTQQLVPTQTGGNFGWVAVAAGGDSTLAITTDGSLWAWGDNHDGQLGDGTTDERDGPTRVGMDTDWVAVAEGDAHSLALKSDGSLWAWGDNSSGQLGDGTTTIRCAPTRVGSGTKWAAIDAGGSHSLALKSDGSLWAWGRNNEGQLGDGTGTNRLTPTRVGNGTKWVTVAAGGDFSLALKSDGTLWAWGTDYYQQLGDGAPSMTLARQLAPVEILTLVKVPRAAAEESTTTTGASTTTTEAATTTTEASTTTTEVSSPTFSDIASSPYKTAIKALAGAGIVTGFQDGTFRPDDAVTRQQFAKMIVKTLGYKVTGREVCPFIDVAAQVGSDPLYPSKYVAECASHGITQGKTATTFDPTADITHEQLITMVTRAAGANDPPATYMPAFTASQFSLNEHYLNARKAENAGLLVHLLGISPTYDFQASSTRGECAQILYNLWKL